MVLSTNALCFSVFACIPATSCVHSGFVESCGLNTLDGDWFYVNTTGECLYFSRRPESWNGAQDVCETMGTNLVSVTNNQTLDFIRVKSNQFADSAIPFWIGLYQSDSQSKEHLWIDGQVSLFRNWQSNEPSEGDGSDAGLQRCVGHNSWNGKWKDMSCGRSLPFICAKSDRVARARPTSAPVVGGACAPDWVEYRKMLLTIWHCPLRYTVHNSQAHQPVCLPVCLSVCLFISMSVCWFICISVCGSFLRLSLSVCCISRGSTT